MKLRTPDRRRWMLQRRKSAGMTTAANAATGVSAREAADRMLSQKSARQPDRGDNAGVCSDSAVRASDAQGSVQPSATAPDP
jgi:hypothetical protein